MKTFKADEGKVFVEDGKNVLGVALYTPDNYDATRLTAGVYLSALEDGKLTFFCSTKPTSDLPVNVEINNVRGLSE